MKMAVLNPDCVWLYHASAEDFKKVKGSPIAYWTSDDFRKSFSENTSLKEIASPRAGLATGDNLRFQRAWSEVSLSEIAFDCESNNESKTRRETWYPCNSGGQFRKWFGNHEVIVNWKNDGFEIRNFKDSAGKLRSRPQNTHYFFKCGVTWTKLGSGTFAARYRPTGLIFDDTGRSAFSEDGTSEYDILSLICSNAADRTLKVLNPSLSFTSGDIGNLPFVAIAGAKAGPIAEQCVKIACSDWDAYETSWDFTTLPLLHSNHRAETMEHTYTALRSYWQGMTDEMQQLEEENNRIFIDAYGLQDELTPEVPLNEITLTCNPAYRYGGKTTVEDRETRLRADTVAEFLSYAVGCMFGRYSLDAPGLILANQGETLADYLTRIPDPQFMPDADNVIPMLDADWFPDDITERFRLFLRATFGDDTLRENLAFIEDALGKDIRKYFTKDFYANHVKRYKKRPIYWLFASPKGSFQALIYMHRYRSDTVSVVLNDYLREYISKLEAERGRLEKLSDDASAGQTQRTKALKDMAGVGKQIEELNAWERDVVFPMAQQKIEIDLDDGVKANYPKFGTALNKIPGLEAKND
jgi:type II restriction/modification system DNA methylase subunit YeeA